MSQLQFNPGGSLIIVEPDLANSANHPAIPHFDEMLARYHQSAAGEDRIRGQLDELPSLAAARQGWIVAGDRRLASVRIGPFAGTILQRAYQRWVDLCQESGMFHFDFDRARQSVDEWSNRSSVFSRVGLRILDLRRDELSGESQGPGDAGSPDESRRGTQVPGGESDSSIVEAHHADRPR